MKFHLETLQIDGENVACLFGLDGGEIATVATFRFKPNQPLRITEAPEPPKTLLDGFWPKSWRKP